MGAGTNVYIYVTHLNSKNAGGRLASRTNLTYEEIGPVNNSHQQN